MLNFLKKQSAARIFATGFAILILLGSLLLIMPFSVKEGVELGYIDSLYTSASAVCVTGLVTVDVGDTFTPIGQTILAILIHIGGLGVASVSAGVVLAMGKKMNLKSRNLIKEAMNIDSGKAAAGFVREVFLTTVIIELTGAILSFTVFIRDYPPLEAIGISLFHSIAAFNNAGFDILGNFQSLTAYKDNILLNLTTAGLIFFGGIGFLVIKELWTKRCRWKKLSMHARVVLSLSGALILIGTVILKLTENISWLGAFFQSVTTRTAGFATYSIGSFSNAGIVVMMLLMFIGASPGSTGGGIKTSTFFVLLQGMKKAATGKSEQAFKYSIPKGAFRKAASIFLLALSVIFTATFITAILDPEIALRDLLFEITSAFATVGLSTGITPSLSVGSKLVSILVMFIGRLGPLTVAMLGYFSHGESMKYPEGNIAIG